MEKICKYHSNKNCFIYIDSKEQYSNGNPNEKDVFEIEIGNDSNNVAYFSAQLINKSTHNEQLIYFNNFYSKKIKLNENDSVKIKTIHRNHSFATSITIEPISYNDWEILELNLDSVQNGLLDQIKVVYLNQIFPIWVESQMCVFVKTIGFEPAGRFACINSLTRVNVQPVVDRSMSSPNSFSTLNSVLDEWSCLVQIEVENDSAFCNNFKCRNLTTVELSRAAINQLGINISGESDKFIVSLKSLKSPMQSAKYSSHVNKKFIQSIENSYNETYYSTEADFTLYALLNVTNKDKNEYSNEKEKENSYLKITKFLMRQLNAFEINSKVILNTASINLQSILSNTSKRRMKLKTSYNKNADCVRESFVKFIEDQSECLCPFIITDNMKIELTLLDKVEKVEITCLVSLYENEKFIAISSNMILNGLLNIEIEITDNIKYELTPVNYLEAKLFSLNHLVYDCEWFKWNVNQVMLHLKTNLFNQDKTKLKRNLVISGLKASGKTILCKYICNLISKPPYNSLYHYINCQQFMNRTPDTIYEQLKLIYQECVWYSSTPCLVVLENLDLLIENKSHTIDPSSMLYHSQIVEAIKEILIRIVWAADSNTVTIVTVSSSFNEMASLFHCIDDHGLFSEFFRIKYHSDKIESKEIIDLILKKRHVTFDNQLIEKILSITDGCVFKDIEKLIDSILFSNYSMNTLENISKDRQTICLNENNNQDLVYNFVCINLLETKFYKAQSDLNWNLIGGLDSVKETLIETLIWPVKYAKLYEKLGMKQSSGTLLYGPSGCGKTLIASALANESQFNFISVKGPELLSKYIGNSEQNVRELFLKAEKAKPCIIFFDEFDSMAPRRGHDSTGVTDRVVNQLLVQLDGVENLTGVYLLAASSRPDLIDQALLRPGRLDNFLYIGYPTQEEIKRIFEIYSNDIRLENDVDFDKLIELCQDLSGADIKSIVCDSFLKAFHRLHSTSPTHGLQEETILRSSIRINQSDFISSIQAIQQTINKNERIKLKKMYENWTSKKGISLNSANTNNSNENNARVTLA